MLISDDPVFETQQEKKIYLFSKATREAVGQSQVPVLWISGSFCESKALA